MRSLRRLSLGTAALLLAPALAAGLLAGPGAAEQGGAPGPPDPAGPLPPGPGGAAGLAGAAHVVVAVVDTGINPYHREFRDAAYAAHPATYIAGYPAEARPLDLCVEPAAGCPEELRAARLRDAAAWAGVGRTALEGDAWGPLHYVPGTRIVGAVSLGPDGDPFVRPTRVFDDDGHGTATASLAAGRTLGMCPACLLVVVEGPGEEALAWVRDQPWIDVVANAWGWQLNLGWPPPPFGAPNAETTRSMVEAGQTVVFSAGNGLALDTAPGYSDVGDYLLPGESTYTSEHTGPDWIVTVGAVDPENGQPVAGSARPVDVVAAGVDVPAAGARSRSGVEAFSGTSAAAPLVAGAFGHVLLQARRALGDAREGPRVLPGSPDAVAHGPPPPGGLAGPLGDGVLTRAELQRAVYATARPCVAAPDGAAAGAAACPEARAPWPFPMRMWGWSAPTPPVAYPMLVGYGAVTPGTRDAAAAAVLGLEPAPPRPEADLWARSDSVLRQRMWGFWSHGARLGDLLGP